MYILKTEASFDSAHFLFGYEGKCSNIHGHRWKIILEVKTEELKDDVQHRGMYVDFGELKKDLRELADSMDHALIIEKNTLKETTLEALKSENFQIIALDFRPTAENMARYFHEKIKALGYNMHAVTMTGVFRFSMERRVISSAFPFRIRRKMQQYSWTSVENNPRSKNGGAKR